MGAVKEALIEIQYMILYGTNEQKKGIQEIIEQHQYDEREMQRELLKFITKDKMSRN